MGHAAAVGLASNRNDLSSLMDSVQGYLQVQWCQVSFQGEARVALEECQECKVRLPGDPAFTCFLQPLTLQVNPKGARMKGARNGLFFTKGKLTRVAHLANAHRCCRALIVTLDILVCWLKAASDDMPRFYGGYDPVLMQDLCACFLSAVYRDRRSSRSRATLAHFCLKTHGISRIF